MAKPSGGAEDARAGRERERERENEVEGERGSAGAEGAI